jgi:murein DD-endopeptidase MepM/ murein hydrolase activator NlpD
MSKKDEKKKFIERLKDKYRLIVYNDKTFEQIGFIRLTKMNIIAFGGGGLIFLLVAIYFLISYTPLRELVPGYPDSNVRRNIILNAFKLDSLEAELNLRDQYIRNINYVISGKEPENFKSDTTASTASNVNFNRSGYDSAFRRQLEQSERFNLVSPSNSGIADIANIHFFSPVKGIVTNSFNDKEYHFGTDIVAGPNEVVKAAYDGTIFMTSWTLETGHVIMIQHDDDLISTYQHNAELLKKKGSRVRAGESIAIIGNSGELTTGPHLHFELWYKGKPINAEDYIDFN